jgi:glycosyltransferase involved in cell wall biosynthesis
MTKSTVCLNMIVKNEAHVITRCIRSVRPHIDSYCIVDTGSTDDTKQMIKGLLADIPGEVFDRPWVNFGHNRTEALQLAQGRADYILVIDADDVIVGAKPAALIHDQYELTVEDNGITYRRNHIFKDGIPFYYKGPVHEVISYDGPLKLTCAHLPGLRYRRYVEGARSQVSVSEKYLRDAKLLEEALVTEPDNARYMYYLGQSYRDAREPDKAIEIFEKRAKMVGFHEEGFMALYYVAQMTMWKMLQAKESVPIDDEAVNRIVNLYMRAYEYRPTRLEAIYELCMHLNSLGKHAKSYALCKGFVDRPVPNEILFLDRSVYDWKMKDCAAEAAFHIGNKHEARLLWEQLLRDRRLPLAEVVRIQHNARSCAEFGELSFPVVKIEENHIESGFGSMLDQFKKNVAAGGTELGAVLMLFSLAVSTRAETIVEIGRYRGASTFALASALKFLKIGWKEPPEAHQRPGIDYKRLEGPGIERRLYSIEKSPLPEVRVLIEETGLSEFVGFVDRPSSDVKHEDLENRPVDFLFIDGDHTFEGCMSDVQRYVPMVRKGGLFVLHDYFGWFKDNVNGSPIKQVCDALVGDGYEHLLVDTNYMSLMVFRKS